MKTTIPLQQNRFLPHVAAAAAILWAICASSTLGRVEGFGCVATTSPPAPNERARWSSTHHDISSCCWPPSRGLLPSLRPLNTALRSTNGPTSDLRESPFTDEESASSSSYTYRTLTGMQRIFCLSDLHTDHVDNQRYLHNLLQSSHTDLTQQDLLIVAGDISHEIHPTLVETLSALLLKCQVFFVPGNHEAWLNRPQSQQDLSTGPPMDSFQKLQNVLDTCRDLGVHVDPLYLEGSHPVWIVPLQAWYDGTLSFCEELCQDFASWPWVDFARCVWGENFPLQGPASGRARIPRHLVTHFLRQNRPHIHHIRSQLWSSRTTLSSSSSSSSSLMAPARSEPPGLITVSHFLPNRQTLPDWKDIQAEQFDVERWLDHGAGGMSAKFAKVAGSMWLDRQLRSFHEEAPSEEEEGAATRHRLRHVHVFGHSHRPKDFEWRGIRYIHNPLGKPRERQMHMINPAVTFQHIWQVQPGAAGSGGEVPGPRIIRYWEEEGGGTQALNDRWESLRPVRSQRDHRY